MTDRTTRRVPALITKVGMSHVLKYFDLRTQLTGSVKTFSMVVASNAVILLLGLVTGSVTARLLGAEGRGELALIQLWPSWLSTLVVSGFASAVTFYCVKRPEATRAYYITAMALVSVPALGTLALGYFAIPWLLRATPHIVNDARVYLTFIPIGIVTGISLAALQSRHNLKLWNTMRVIPSFAWLIALLVLREFWKAPGAQVVSRAYLWTFALMAAVCLFIVIAYFVGRTTFTTGLAGPIASFAAPSSIGTFAQQSAARFDQMLLALIAPATTLGYYVIASTWSSAASPLASAVCAVGLPKVAAQCRKDAPRVAVRVLALGVSVNLASAFVLGILTPLSLPLIFGNDFSSSVSPACVLVAAGCASSVRNVIGEVARGLGKPSLPIAPEAMGIVAMAGTMHSAFHFAGLFGVAAAVLFAQTTALIISFWFLARTLHMRPQNLLLSLVTELGAALLGLLTRHRAGGKGGNKSGEESFLPEADSNGL